MALNIPLTRVPFRRSFALMMAGLVSVCAGAIALVIAVQPVQAATNNTINFQARLQNATGSIVPDGYYNIQFKLYDAASAGSNLWTESHYDSNGVTAGNDNRVRVKNGYLTVSLGSQTAFPGGLNWDQEMWLTMNVGGTTQTASPTYDGEMNPRLKLTGVPYAFRAGELAKYDSTTTYNAILQLPSATVGNQTFTIPDQAAAGNYTLLTTNTANSSFVQNTTSPQTANFNITGNGTIGGNLTANGTALFQNSSNSTTAFQIQNAAGTGNTFVVDTVNNRVGIGTNAPNSHLHIADIGDVRLRLEADTNDITEGDNPSIIMTQDGNTRAFELGMNGDAGAEFTNALQNAAYAGSLSATPLQLITNDAARLTIESGGNVGINTTGPLGLLHVQGTAFVNHQFGSASAATVDLAIGDSDTGFDGYADGQTSYFADGSEKLRMTQTAMNLMNNTNFVQNGTGTFATGTGAVTLNGNVSVVAGKDLTANGLVNKLKLNKEILHSADANGHNYHIAQLPFSTFGTHDHIRLTASINSNWHSNTLSYIDATFALRSGFTYQYSVRGQAVQSCATLKAYDNAGYVDIYLSFSGACGFTTATYTVLESQNVAVIQDGTDVGATPAGTVVFDASIPATYKPTSYTAYNGDSTSYGNATVNGDVSIGNVAGRSTAGRLMSDGFESGNLSLWDTNVGGSSTVAIDTSVVRNGKYSVKVTNDNGISHISAPVNDAPTMSVRGYVYVASQTSGSSADLFYLYDQGTANGVGLYRRQSDGLLRVWNDYTNASIDTSAVLTTGAWHKLEMVFTTNATTGSFTVYLDDVNVLTTASNIDTGSDAPDIAMIGDGNAGRNFVFYADDFVVDTVRAGDSANLNVNDSLHVAGTSTFGGAALFQPASDSDKAFMVQNTAGTTMIGVDTLSGDILVGNYTGNVIMNAGLLHDGNTWTTGRLAFGDLVNDAWINDVITGWDNGTGGTDGYMLTPVNDPNSDISDLRLYLMDDSNDTFSIWGDPCGGGDCDDVNEASMVAQFSGGGDILLNGETTVNGNLIIDQDDIWMNNSTNGIILNGADRPIITRNWDSFTSGTYSGVGRWGMFMAPTTLTLGVPNTGSNGNFQLARYNADSTIGSVPLYIRDDGNVGIGNNTSPGYKLDVAGGDINVSGGYRVAGTAGTAVTCSGGQLLQNATSVGGIITGGSCVAGGTGITTIGAFSNTSIANGGSITGNTLTFGAADATNPGMLSTGTQTIGGAKTFNGVTTLADRVVLSGTVTTGSNTRLLLTGTLNSSTITSQYGLQSDINFTPTGASLNNVYGISGAATISGSALNISKLVGVNANLSTTSGYTGQVALGIGFEVSAPSIGGSQLIADYRGLFVNGVSTNGGNTSGTINNHQLRFNGITAGAGTGGTVNNYGMYVTQPSGSGGTTNNYGIYITGAGGGNTNYAIYNTGTAPIYTQGNLQVGTTSNSNGYALQVAGDINSTTGAYRTGNTIRLDNAGALQNITGYTQTSGNASYVAGSKLLIGAADYGAALNVLTGATGNIGMVIRQTSGQTADLLQLQNAATGAVLTKFDALGRATVAALASTDFITATTTISADGNITNGGFDFKLGTTDQSSRGNSGLSRAMVKDTGNKLVLNYAADYTGGTEIQSALNVTGGDLHLSRAGDAKIILEADTDNSGEADNPVFELRQDGGNNIGQVGFAGNAGDFFTGSQDNAMFMGALGSNALQLFTASAARMTISGTGNVGIGTTAPAAKLEVNGDIAVGSAANRSGAARYFTDGFESNNYNHWTWGTNVSGSSALTIDSSIVKNGKYSAKVVSNNGNANANTNFPNTITADVVVRANVYISSHTSGAADIYGIYSDNSYIMLYRNQSDGVLRVYRDIGGTVTDQATSATFTTGAWHTVEMVVNKHGSTGSITVYYDGVSVYSPTNINTHAEWAYGLVVGADNTSSAYTAYIDDVVVDSVRPGDSASLNVNDSLHVAGTSSFGGAMLIQPSTYTNNALIVRARNDDVLFNVDAESYRVGIGTGSAAQTLSVSGSFGGDQVRDVRNISTSATYNVTGEGLSYYLESNSGTTNSNITSTFNITGLPNVDGTVAFIQLYVSKGVTSNSRWHNVTIQVHGSTLGSIETLTQLGADESYRAFSVARFDGVWMVTGSNPEFQIGFDLAEWIPYTGTKPEAGDILVTGDDREGASAKKSAGAYDNRIVGVVTTKPGQVLGKDDGHSVKMALSGRVPVKVSLENGPIEPGDYLTSATVPGFAMKATVAGKVVGTAYTAYDGTQDEATVMVQVQPGYAVPDGGSAVSLQGGGLQGTGVADGQVSDDADATDADIAVQLLQVQAAGLQADVDALQDITSGFGAMINTGVLQAGNLTVSGNALIQGDFAVLGMATLRGVTIEGHISTKGEAPAVELLPAAGLPPLDSTGAMVEIDGTDVTGTVAVIAGDDPEGDLLVRVMFHHPFDKRPRIVLTPEGKGSARLQAYVENPSVSGFIVGVSNLPTSGERYVFTYQVLE